MPPVDFLECESTDTQSHVMVPVARWTRESGPAESLAISESHRQPSQQAGHGWTAVQQRHRFRAPDRFDKSQLQATEAERDAALRLLSSVLEQLPQTTSDQYDSAVDSTSGTVVPPLPSVEFTSLKCGQDVVMVQAGSPLMARLTARSFEVCLCIRIISARPTSYF